MIEPAAFGAVIMFGPNTSNFRDVVALFNASNACLQYSEAGQLVDGLRGLVANQALRDDLGHAAKNVVLQQQGATNVTVQLLSNLVKQESKLQPAIDKAA